MRNFFFVSILYYIRGSTRASCATTHISIRFVYVTTYPSVVTLGNAEKSLSRRDGEREEKQT